MIGAARFSDGTVAARLHAAGIETVCCHLLEPTAVAIRFGELFGRAPVLTGAEEPLAWHSDCSEAQRLFGDPLIDLDTMIKWNADWLKRGMPVPDNPTHYDEHAGAF